MQETSLYDRYHFKTELERMGTVLLTFFAAQYLMMLPFQLVQRQAGGPALTPLAASLITMMCYLSTMVMTLVFAHHLFQRKAAFLFPLQPVRLDYALPAVGAGLMGTLGGALAAVVVTAVLAGFGLQFQNFTPPLGYGPGSDIVMVITLVLLPPVAEELLFRGALLQPLRRYGDRLAIVVSALLFGAVHSTLPQMLSAFVMGLALGVFTVRSGSLLPAMGIHLLNNGLAVVQTLLLAGTTDLYKQAAIGWASLLFMALVGGGCCLYLSRRFGRVWWVAPGGTPSVPRRDAMRAVLTCPPLVVAVVIGLLIMLQQNFMGS